MPNLKSRELPRLAAGKRHADGGGLYFKVPKSGNGGSWVYVYRRLGGKGQTEFGLGTWPDVSLDEARKRHLEAKSTRARGIDPKAERLASARRSKTFEDIARDYWSTHVDGHVAKPSNWIAGMERHVFPVIGAKIASAITVDDLVTIFQPIWEKEHARKLKQWVGRVLVASEMEDNSVDPRLIDKLVNRLGPQDIENTHHAALPWERAADLYASCPHTLVGVSLRLLMLTAVRVHAVTAMEWSEVDLQNGIWTIPAARIKGWKTGFRVPLSPQACSALRRASRLWGEKGYVFPSPTAKSGHLSNNTHRLWLHKRGWKDEDGNLVTAHGLRSTFGGYCEDNDADLTLADFCLQHRKAKQGETQAAYFRRDLLERRRVIMDAWGSYLTSTIRKRGDLKLQDQSFDILASGIGGETHDQGDKADWFEIDPT